MALKHFDFSRMNLPDRCLPYFFSENVVARNVKIDWNHRPNGLLYAF